MQVLGIAGGQFIGQSVHGRQRPADRPGHDHQQHGQHQQPGHDLGQRQAIDQLIALVQTLARSDLPLAIAGRQVVQPPGLALHLQVREPGGLPTKWQGHAIAIGQCQVPVYIPDRHGQIAHIGIPAGLAPDGRHGQQRGGIRLRVALPQRGLHLLRQAHQLGVKQLIDFVPGLTDREIEGHTPDQGRTDQQIQQQAALQAHGAPPQAPRA